MTAAWRSKVPQVGFRKWVRENPELDSRKSSITINDIDLLVAHKYKTDGMRSCQMMMFIEVKTFGAGFSDTQYDSLHFVNQITRNRRNVRTNFQANNCGPRICKAYSWIQKKDVSFMCFGVHSLKFSGDGSDPASGTIHWDQRPLTGVDQLEAILRFDLDPDTLCPLDYRPYQRHGSRPLRKRERDREYSIIEEMDEIAFSGKIFIA